MRTNRKISNKPETRLSQSENIAIPTASFPYSYCTYSAYHPSSFPLACLLPSRPSSLLFSADLSSAPRRHASLHPIYRYLVVGENLHPSQYKSTSLTTNPHTHPLPPIRHTPPANLTKTGLIPARSPSPPTTHHRPSPSAPAPQLLIPTTPRSFPPAANSVRSSLALARFGVFHHRPAIQPALQPAQRPNGQTEHSTRPRTERYEVGGSAGRQDHAPRRRTSTEWAPCRRPCPSLWGSRRLRNIGTAGGRVAFLQYSTVLYCTVYNSPAPHMPLQNNIASSTLPSPSSPATYCVDSHPGRLNQPHPAIYGLQLLPPKRQAPRPHHQPVTTSTSPHNHTPPSQQCHIVRAHETRLRHRPADQSAGSGWTQYQVWRHRTPGGERDVPICALRGAWGG